MPYPAPLLTGLPVMMAFPLFDINKEFRFISSVAIFVYAIKHN